MSITKMKTSETTAKTLNALSKNRSNALQKPSKKTPDAPHYCPRTPSFKSVVTAAQNAISNIGILGKRRSCHRKALRGGEACCKPCCVCPDHASAVGDPYRFAEISSAELVR